MRKGTIPNLSSNMLTDLWQRKQSCEPETWGSATILSLDFDGAEEQLKIGTVPAPNTLTFFEKSGREASSV
jgi:hypothetical protein